MSIANATETAILKLVFQAVAWANYADNAATTPQTQVAVGLHTADPGDAGTMSTSEIAYTGYARVAVLEAQGLDGAADLSYIETAAQQIAHGRDDAVHRELLGVAHFHVTAVGGEKFVVTVVILSMVLRKSFKKPKAI